MIYALLLVFIAAPSVAQDATSAEKAAISQLVENFDTATRTNDYEGILSVTLPPKIIAAIGSQFGVMDEKLLRAAIIAKMTEVMSATKFETFSMMTNDADYRRLSNGELYAVIPTRVIIILGGNRYDFKGATLAMMDEGKWWLIRIEKKQLPLLHKAYPKFAGIDLPPETMEITKQ